MFELKKHWFFQSKTKSAVEQAPLHHRCAGAQDCFRRWKMAMVCPKLAQETLISMLPRQVFEDLMCAFMGSLAQEARARLRDKLGERRSGRD